MNRKWYQKATPHCRRRLRPVLLSFAIVILSTFCCGFSFDNWLSGQKLHNICEIAKNRGQKFRRIEKGVSGDNLQSVALRAINPTTICSNLENIDRLYYGKTLFEKPCSIALYFTPKSKKLQTIQATWDYLSLQRLQARTFDNELLQKIIKAISNKYGSPKVAFILGFLEI